MDPKRSPCAQPPQHMVRPAGAVFGARVEQARRFAELLITEGVLRGLIGPREAPRIWDRHILNCAVVQELVPKGSSVVDVGSGAGLPGIVLAIARPDVTVTLLEPLARRTAFLAEAVAALDLDDRVTVHRGRAEDAALPPADVVTARAVAPLDRLAGWCLPLLRPGGRLLAIKGSSAAAEAAGAAPAVRRLGGAEPVIRRCGVGTVTPPTTVVEIYRAPDHATGGEAVRRSDRPVPTVARSNPRRSSPPRR